MIYHCWSFFFQHFLRTGSKTTEKFQISQIRLELRWLHLPTFGFPCCMLAGSYPWFHLCVPQFQSLISALLNKHYACYRNEQNTFHTTVSWSSVLFHSFDHKSLQVLLPDDKRLMLIFSFSSNWIELEVRSLGFIENILMSTLKNTTLRGETLSSFVLHEISSWLTATETGVQASRFSLDKLNLHQSRT